MPFQIVVAFYKHSRTQHRELAEKRAVVVGIDFVVARVEEPEALRA